MLVFLEARHWEDRIMRSWLALRQSGRARRQGLGQEVGYEDSIICCWKRMGAEVRATRKIAFLGPPRQGTDSQESTNSLLTLIQPLRAFPLHQSSIREERLTIHRLRGQDIKWDKEAKKLRGFVDCLSSDVS